MEGSEVLIELLLLFLGWSVMVAVSAHRRVRNVILASAGAAGVATGSFFLLLALTSSDVEPLILLVYAVIVGLPAGLAVALLTRLVMKLGGWLPPPDAPP